MSTPIPDAFSASQELAKADYNRRRLEPDLNDPDYLHLSDLRLALDQALPSPGSVVLDYGCGGSPYQPLFKAARYDRADIPGIPGLQFVFGEDSRLDAPSATYDCVLSTQVLEHVGQVQTYLGECFRLLKPGGRLILTTHGIFPDHGCPYDFQRWTADGLRVEIERAGLVVDQVSKLTTSGRAIVYLNTLFNHRMVAEAGASTPAGLLMRFGRFFYTKLSLATRHRYADLAHANCRVVPCEDREHVLYIALLAVAHRPPDAQHR